MMGPTIDHAKRAEVLAASLAVALEGFQCDWSPCATCYETEQKFQASRQKGPTPLVRMDRLCETCQLRWCAMRARTLAQHLFDQALERAEADAELLLRQRERGEEMIDLSDG